MYRYNTIQYQLQIKVVVVYIETDGHVLFHHQLTIINDSCRRHCC